MSGKFVNKLAPCFLILAAVVISLVDNAIVHPLDTDMSWLLTVSDRMIDGERLYSDIWETNPPFSVLLYFPAAWIAHHLPVRAEAVVVVMAYLWLLASIALSGFVIRQAHVFTGAEEMWLLAATLGFALLSLPQTFAQREFFAVLGSLPALALVTAGRRSAADSEPAVTARMAAGVFASVTVMVKPFYLAAILVPYAYRAYARRSFRPLFRLELLTAAAIGLVYLAAVLWLFPDYLRNVLPVATDVYFGRRWSPFSKEMMFDSPMPWALVFVVVYGFIARRAGCIELHFPVFLCFLAWFSFFVMLGKGFPYHALPFFVIGGLAVCIAAISFFRKPQRIHSMDGKVTLCLLVFCFVATSYSGVLAFHRNPTAEAIRNEYGPRLQGKSVAVIASNISAGHPFTRLIDGRWIGRECGDWIGAYSLEKLSHLDPASPEYQGLDRQIAAAVERKKLEILTGRPEVVIVDHHDYWWLDRVLENQDIKSTLANDYEVLGSDQSLEFLLLRGSFR